MFVPPRGCERAGAVKASVCFEIGHEDGRSGPGQQGDGTVPEPDCLCRTSPAPASLFGTSPALSALHGCKLTVDIGRRFEVVGLS